MSEVRPYGSSGVEHRGRPAPPSFGADDRLVRLFGVEITDVTMARALALVEEMIRDFDGRSRSLYFVNAHTLNLAWRDPAFRDVLRSATRVFGDGTGVRWAARLRGIRVRDNLVGTDLIPALFEETAGRGYSCYLLGSDEASIARAARYVSETFPGWKVVGSHHGYLGCPALNEQVIQTINAAAPHLLLVGMGNPLQEKWISTHLDRLRVPVCVGVGGLFDYWAGNLRRAPRWIRRLGCEWVWILMNQPRKAGRYLGGNPAFLFRALCDRLSPIR